MLSLSTRILKPLLLTIAFMRISYGATVDRPCPTTTIDMLAIGGAPGGPEHDILHIVLWVQQRVVCDYHPRHVAGECEHQPPEG